MKALKSKLASELLADPAASEQLRRFLVNREVSGQRRSPSSGAFVVRGKDGVVRVEATIVPKAAKAA
ncbi:hypothetical protein [Massilia brevitalea]|uniref:hypothetical protein n=1 Tax=Massilia brevitalea TaxID=442526 RepID=UPI00273A1CA9|nr:hypothetical protein [Massilia brevitalea]